MNDYFAQRNDYLTQRERFIYKILHGLGLAISAGAFLWYFILRYSSPTTLEVFILGLPVSLVLVFGLALKTDTRIIYGIKWLRKPGKVFRN